MRELCVFEKDGVHLYRFREQECQYCCLPFDDMGEKEETDCEEPSLPSSVPLVEPSLIPEPSEPATPSLTRGQLLLPFAE